MSENIDHDKIAELLGAERKPVPPNVAPFVGGITVPTELAITERALADARQAIAAADTRIADLERENARLREASANLIADVRRRYPGEPLRCPYMRAIEAALAKEVGLAAHAPEQEQAQPVATPEQVTPPAGESVEDQMRARGFWWNTRHCAWIQMDRRWLVQEMWSSSDGTTWTAQVDGSVFGNHPDPLTAADACERHAKEQHNG